MRPLPRPREIGKPIARSGEVKKTGGRVTEGTKAITAPRLIQVAMCKGSAMKYLLLRVSKKYNLMYQGD